VFFPDKRIFYRYTVVYYDFISLVLSFFGGSSPISNTGKIKKMSGDEQDESTLKKKKKMKLSVSTRLKQSAEGLREQLSNFKAKSPVSHIYNPLEYAWSSHCYYLETYADKPSVLLVGLNPGPWGMSQTGIPFGEIDAVKNFLNVPTHLKITQPEKMNANRIVEGFQCKRAEVSGKRLWGFMQRRFGNAENMSKYVYVYNYCPLAFMAKSGLNITPDKLDPESREKLFEICDEALSQVISILQPKAVCGIGAVTGERCRIVCGDTYPIGILQHPSPASPSGRIWESANYFDQLFLNSRNQLKSIEEFLK
jgi:single-strand selective monofunctional uracil DNA glycosylase